MKEIFLVSTFLFLFLFLILISSAAAIENWTSDADRPTMEDNLQYHIQCRSGDINKYVLLPGDPGRVDLIAKEWDEAKFVAFNREYKTFSGKIGDVSLSACSTGIGGPSTSIAIEELAELGAETFIRVGTCGAIHEGIKCGDIIICSGAVRHDGASDEYIETAYPALANHEVILALIQACEKLGKNYHVGISCSTSTFHAGQARPGFKGYTQSFFENKIKDLQNARVLNFEMEAATVLTLAGIYGFRAGAVFVVVADRNNNTFTYTGIDDSVKIANEAVKILASWDKVKSEKNKEFFYPDLLKK
ncbi:MAG: uridine phosphorylase [Synergistales bacterium]|nr:uridine phosphorylase [Synergistales bacterium]MDY6401107.1 uridine phosphorylase [Synergistales bacterium]MDY6404700.1 uridine phosphorylase [Synergistales bacterium]MDY6415145.1 uridine phosphorylase [Synergistales bacterium]MDY6422392.1 uridine phosphorylase [Synergistales bacterium]